MAPRVENAEVDAFHRKLLDYLRRLTGKLGQYAVGETFIGPRVFAAYLEEQNYGVDGPSVAQPIAWDNVIRQDSIYTQSFENRIIEVSEAGLYIVEVDFMINKNFQVDIAIGTVNSVGVVIEIPLYANTVWFPLNQYDTKSLMVPMLLEANDKIAVLVDCSDLHILQDGSRLLITKIEDE